MFETIAFAVIISFYANTTLPNDYEIKHFESVQECQLWKRQKDFEFLPQIIRQREVICQATTGVRI